MEDVFYGYGHSHTEQGRKLAIVKRSGVVIWVLQGALFIQYENEVISCLHMQTI